MLLHRKWLFCALAYIHIRIHTCRILSADGHKSQSQTVKKIAPDISSLGRRMQTQWKHPCDWLSWKPMSLFLFIYFLGDISLVLWAHGLLCVKPWRLASRKEAQFLDTCVGYLQQGKTEKMAFQTRSCTIPPNSVIMLLKQALSKYFKRRKLFNFILRDNVCSYI